MTSADRIVLASILRGAGVPPADGERITTIAGPKVLPTPMPIEWIAAGVLAALGTVVSGLYAARNAVPPQTGSVTTRAAGLAVAASNYLRVDGRDLKDRDRLTGFYRAADGWAFLHGNFPHLRDGLLALFDSGDKSELARALSDRPAREIEQAAVEWGLCAVARRDRTEWERTRQAIATRSLPLLEIRRIGSAPAEPLPPAASPLEGVRVLDLSRVIAGPMVGRTMAEHGATVMRVSGPHLPSIPPLVIETGFGKLSSFLDLRVPADAARLRELVMAADVFIDAYRPGALAGIGFGPEALARMRPGMVVVALSAFSRAGDWYERRGYDSLVQAAAGLAPTGPDGAPRRLPCQPLDYMSGYLGALGAMVALRRRMDEGGSWLVQLSLERTAAWLFEMADRLGDDDAVPAERPGGEDVADLLMETPSAFGRIRHFRPPLTLTETPGSWTRPPVPLGSDPPEWPDVGGPRHR